MDRREPSLEKIFSPRGIAVVGVSPTARISFANMIVRSLKEAGFPAIYPVNPNHTEAFGLPCYPNLRAIPGIVDHVVVSIPAESVLELLDDCAAKGVRSVAFFTAGFSESGYAERIELEKAMLSKAKAGNFRIIGPNCVGMFVPKSRIIDTSSTLSEPGPIAFISQSGGYTRDIAYLGGPRGLRFSKIVSYGNALDVDESELLQYLSQDPETGIIAAYIEGVKDGKRFLKALKEATSRKPVVIYKGGTTGAGRRATESHTASLTASAEAPKRACSRASRSRDAGSSGKRASRRRAARRLGIVHARRHSAEVPLHRPRFRRHGAHRHPARIGALSQGAVGHHAGQPSDHLQAEPGEQLGAVHRGRH
ncbi:MAG: CoA-binding protein [Chloroflexi bacterium]|nr:CoA-binding protein [Chloroflexota bacterium]